MVEVDTKDLEDLLKRLEDKGLREQACIKATKGLAGDLHKLVTNATPVKSGHLRRKWTVEPVQKNGDTYSAQVINNVEYASYVNYGHWQEVGRYVPAIGKRLVRPYVLPKKHHFMERSEEKLKSVAVQEARYYVEEYVKKVLDG